MSVARLEKIEFFQGLDPNVLAQIAEALEQVSIRAGEYLLRQGEEGDALFVVLNGRLAAEFQNDHGTRRVGEVAPGEIVGEMAMLSLEPRATSVRALRDSEALKFTRSAFDFLAEQHPVLMRRLAALIAGRLRASNAPAQDQRTFRTVLLVAHDTGVDLDQFATRLEEAMRAYRETLLIFQESGPASQDLRNADARDNLLEWLTAQENNQRTLLFMTRSDHAEWNAIIMARADLVLVIASADAKVAPGSLERLIPTALAAERELVLLYRPDAVPHGTARWLTPGRFARHHHVCPMRAGHVERLARWLCGYSVGVAFGGGGARGFGHIGVMRAFADAGLPIDRVGGTSMGSIMAAQVALEWTPAKMLDVTARAFAVDPLKRDNTLPLVSLITCRRVVRLFEDMFGDQRAEDCWLPYFCVSCNMTQAEATTHRDGLLWQRIRASSALPGIGPPVIMDGEFYVDGAVLNNLPANILVGERAGPVIAINVSPKEDLASDWPDNFSLSGWRLLWHRLKHPKAPKPYPSMLWVLQRTVLLNSVASAEAMKQLVALYLQPPVGDYEMFGWSKIREIEGVSFDYARPQVLLWTRSFLGLPVRSVRKDVSSI